MFKLTEAELQAAFEALRFHGYSGLLPHPPEWTTLDAKWDEIRKDLSTLDLDVYAPAKPFKIYAPKSRATVRVVSMLHPTDVVLYTALTLIVKDDIERARVSPKRRIVYSYRSQLGVSNRLYSTADSYARFRARLHEKAHNTRTALVPKHKSAVSPGRHLPHLPGAVIHRHLSRTLRTALTRPEIGHMAQRFVYGGPSPSHVCRFRKRCGGASQRRIVPAE